MRRIIAVLVTVVLVTVPTQSLLARPAQLRSTWDELSRLIQGMEIRMVLPDGTLIRGQELDLRPDVLVVDVRRTSDSRLHAKGRTEIPRADVSTIELFSRRSRAAFSNAGAVGAGLGGVAVSPLLFYLGETDKISGLAALAIAVGAAVGGAMLANRVANRLHGNPPDVLITVVS